MNATITFQQTSATAASMEISYPLGDGESGSEFFTYYAAKPANVIKETKVVTTKGGRKIQLGIQLAGKIGLGVAWAV